MHFEGRGSGHIDVSGWVDRRGVGFNGNLPICICIRTMSCAHAFSCSKARWPTCTPNSLPVALTSTLWLELATKDTRELPKTVQVRCTCCLLSWWWAGVFLCLVITILIGSVKNQEELPERHIRNLKDFGGRGEFLGTKINWNWRGALCWLPTILILRVGPFSTSLHLSRGMVIPFVCSNRYFVGITHLPARQWTVLQSLTWPRNTVPLRDLWLVMWHPFNCWRALNTTLLTLALA